MYRQIFVDSRDSKFQRILWRNTEGIVENFELITVTFGTSSAPWLAIRTLNQLAEDEAKNFPLAAHIVKDNVYVDDVMTGGHSIEETVKIRLELEKMFLSGGFQLKKLAANKAELLEGVPRADQILEFFPKEEKSEYIKTLGVFWSPHADEFMFRVQDIPVVANISKRQVLSWLARFYDPLGWAAPVLLVAKILIQSLWQEGLGWDDNISIKSKTIWDNLAQSLHVLEKIKIPRWIGSTLKNERIELHGFSDASEKAYGAVIYSKTCNNGVVQINLLMAKTKVAPLKTVRLPRLELSAALLLAKMFVSVRQAIKFEVEHIFAWTDSQITLAWIKSSPSKWPTFVANITADVHDLTGPQPWRYVPTKENPADCCSRGLVPQELVNFNLWWNGPSWLKNNEECWPSQQLVPIDEKNLECKKIKVFTTQLESNEQFNMISRFSQLPKLIRVSAWCRRFISNCRAKIEKAPRQTEFLSVQECAHALNYWIRLTQQTSFASEVEELQKPLEKRTSISRKSSIYTLLPFMDEYQLLRVRGRIGNACIPYSERFPIILPHRSELTQLVIENAHHNTLNGGLSETLAYIRRQYWIIKARKAVKLIIQKCINASG